jgi:hypothetical protein
MMQRRSVMISRDNVVSLSGQKLGGQRLTLDMQTTALVAECRSVVDEHLRRLMQSMFDKLDDALYETADKAASHDVQFRYLDAMRDMRKHRAAIEGAFSSHALEYYDEFWRTGPSEGKPGQVTGTPEVGELSLVGEDELEETLAVNAMVSKGENRFERQLGALRQRFARTIGREELMDEDNPIGPACLSDSFRRAVGELQAELAVRLVIYKLFDRQVISYLGGLYDEVNGRFEKAGILANLGYKSRRTPGSRGPKAASAFAPAEELPDGAELFGMLSSLLQAQRAFSPMPMVSLPVVPTADLVGALTQLQQTTLQEAPTDLASIRRAQQGVRDALLRAYHIGNGPNATRALGGLDEDIIDMVSMLFDFILDERNLADPIKALISRLQIPMIKLAMLDRAFFGKKNHPARRLLNSLARAGAGWVDDGDRSPKSLYGRVDAAVTRVLNDFDTDASVLEQVCAEFTQYLETELRGAEVAEERIRQVSRGQEQLKVARSRVTDVIEKRIWSRAELPEVVKDILRSGWKDVMLLTLLREGEDSPSWRKSVDIVDRLIWSVTPKGSPAERQELLSAIPPLLAEIKDGLTMISFDARRSTEMMKELQSCHIACLRGSAPPVGTPSIRGEAAAAPPPSSVEAPAEHVVHDDEFNAQALGLTVGGWLEWTAEDGGTLRGKLSWKSDVTGTYIFVNRKGMKIGEMSVADVAELLRSGRAQILEEAESPLVERALAAMVSALKQRQTVQQAVEIPA